MSGREGELKSALAVQAKERLPGWIFYGHEDVRTGGIPDRSLTGAGRSSWWEFKWGNPTFKAKGQQALACARMEAAGMCRVVIWGELADGSGKRTLIVSPRELLRFKLLEGTPRLIDFRDVPYLAAAFGHDHQFVIDYMRKLHT